MINDSGIDSKFFIEIGKFWLTNMSNYCSCSCHIWHVPIKPGDEVLSESSLTRIHLPPQHIHFTSFSFLPMIGILMQRNIIQWHIMLSVYVKSFFVSNVALTVIADKLFVGQVFLEQIIHNCYICSFQLHRGVVIFW